MQGKLSWIVGRRQQWPRWKRIGKYPSRFTCLQAGLPALRV